jgi:hypothetical protein
MPGVFHVGEKDQRGVVYDRQCYSIHFVVEVKVSCIFVERA